MNAAVVGWALATPLGRDVDAVVARLLAGERSAAANPRFDARSYGCSLASPILDDPPRTGHERVLRRMGRFGYQVAREALEGSGVGAGPRLGLFSGVGGLRAHWDDMLGPLAGQDPSFDGAWERGLRRLHPFWMLQHLSNNAHALVAADVDARGEGATYGGASAGAQALFAAIASLQAGAVDAAVVVAYDSLIEPETVVEMAARGAATGADLGDLTAPYDRAAAGFVPGEAAAAVVLERPGRRPPLAWLSASAIADGRPGAPAPESLAAALAATGFAGGAIDGAALGDREFDADEREVIGGDAPLIAIQAATGQLGAAAPLACAIAAAGCLRRGLLPPIAGLNQPGAGPLSPIAEATETDLTTAGCLSAGAPGLAAAVRVEVPEPGANHE